MAKTNINGNLWKVLIYISGILVTIGVYTTIVKYNCDKIEKVEIRSVQNKEDIIGIKKDISYIREGVDDIKLELQAKN